VSPANELRKEIKQKRQMRSPVPYPKSPISLPPDRQLGKVKKRLAKSTGRLQNYGYLAQTRVYIVNLSGFVRFIEKLTNL